MAAAPTPAQRRVLDELLGVSVEYFRKPELLKAETLFGVAERAAKRGEERRDERMAVENIVQRKPGVAANKRPDNPHHPIGCVLKLFHPAAHVR
jgi:hypothetical protein